MTFPREGCKLTLDQASSNLSCFGWWKSEHTFTQSRYFILFYWYIFNGLEITTFLRLPLQQGKIWVVAYLAHWTGFQFLWMRKKVRASDSGTASKKVPNSQNLCYPKNKKKISKSPIFFLTEDDLVCTSTRCVVPETRRNSLRLKKTCWLVGHWRTLYTSLWHPGENNQRSSLRRGQSGPHWFDGHM